MATEGWLAAGFGAVFVLLLLITAIWLTATGRQPPDEAQWIFRVVMALAGAGFGYVLSGTLIVDLDVPHLAVKATGALALFVLIYLVNPPGLVAQRQHVERGGTGIQIKGNRNRVQR